jgi:type II secretory pathway pseudopilin PulG
VIWVLLDILLGVLVLVGLAVIALGLWRKVKDLGREVSRAGASLAAATDALAQAQADAPVVTSGISTPDRVD